MCSKCELEKEDEQFKYGKVTRTECKDCHNKWRREAAKKYKEKSTTIQKICTECKVEKNGSEFAYSLTICKKCKNERDKEEHNRPAEDAAPKTCTKCEKEQLAIKFRYQSTICVICEKERLYAWRKENPDKFKDICKKYRSKDDYRDKQNKYKRDRYDSELNYKLQTLYRNRVRCFIKGGIKKGNEKYTAMLGCSWSTLREWLSSNFTDEMSWENYGTVWHIDHTMPCSIFDFSIEENIKVCFNWTNLSPMIGVENLSKSDKLNMTLVTNQKEKAHAFITTHLDQILTDSLPSDLRIRVIGSESGVLDTKVPLKDGTGE